MRPVLERLVSEIGRSLDYYRSQFNVERVDRVLLTGGGAKLKNIAPFLSNELHLPVEDFNPLKKIPFDAKKMDSRLVDQRGTPFSASPLDWLFLSRNGSSFFHLGNLSGPRFVSWG